MSRAQFTDYCPLCHHAAGILKQAAKWLEEHGDELPGYTPLEPVPADDHGCIPF